MPETFDDVPIELKGRALRGNPFLKPVGAAVEWTPELLREYQRCRDDRVYFIENYVKIINVDEGLVTFKLRDYQIEMIEAMDSLRCIICTGRQVGKSTTTVGYLLHYVLFNSYKDVGIAANKQETAIEILSRLKRAYLHLPQWLQQGVTKWNEKMIDLENGSRVVAGATSEGSFRGYTIAIMFVDEAAHIDKWEEFQKSVFPTVSSGKSTKIIMVSTPKGMNYFYTIWKNAINKKNSYVPVMVTWDRVPGRDEEWKRREIADNFNGDERAFAQEHCAEFHGSSGTLIDGWKLRELETRDPIHVDDSGCLHIYEEPKPGHQYACTVDMAEGKRLDYSVATVIDITAIPYRQVAQYRSNMVTPTDMAAVTVNLLRMYNEALCLVEFENMGPVVAEKLFEDYEYENMISTVSAGNEGKKIYTGGDAGNVDKGLKMSRVVRERGCSMLKLLVEQNHLELCDEASINELMTFSRNETGKYEAEEGKHDDTCLTLVAFGWLANQRYFKALTDVDAMATMRDRKEQEINDSFSTFFVSDGDRPAAEDKIETVPDLDQWLMG